MKNTYVVILLVILIGCGSESKDKQVRTEPEKEYRIAYNVLFDDEADNYEVFVMNMDGSAKKNITKFGGVEWSYNAAGKELYVISDKDTTHRNYFLYRTDADGSKYEKVSDLRLADSWINSRYDGDELIVEPHRTVDTAFYIIDRNGSILKKLKPPLPYFNDANFSPDGSKIVFRGARKPFKKDPGYRDELFLMNSDGSQLTQLTNYPAKDTTAKWYEYHAGPPMWHPTENFISYQSVQKGKSTLFAILPDGSKQWELFPQDSVQRGWHRWSPDGKWLAVEVFNIEETQYHIQLVNWETKETKTLTDTTYKYQQAPLFVEVD